MTVVTTGSKARRKEVQVGVVDHGEKPAALIPGPLDAARMGDATARISGGLDCKFHTWSLLPNPPMIGYCPVAR